jgi:hypothetical protein
MTNREIGLVWMAYILARLYDTWPGKVTIEVVEAVEATGAHPDGVMSCGGTWANGSRPKESFAWMRAV